MPLDSLAVLGSPCQGVGNQLQPSEQVRSLVVLVDLRGYGDPLGSYDRSLKSRLA